MVSKRAKQNRYKKPGRPWVQVLKQALAATAKLFLGTVLLSAVSLMFVIGYDMLLQNRYFSAERLTVAGCSRLSRQEVLAQAGLRPGINTLAVNLSVARNRLLSHPWIADAKVSREFPAALHIRIQEEQPVAIISLNRAWMVNEGGKIFKTATKAEADGLPVIDGLSYMDLPAAGSAASAPFKAVMTILDLGRQPETPLPNRQIDQITVDREIGPTITAFGGHKTIRMGYGDYAAKYARLQRLMNYLETQGRLTDFVAIDLNGSERVVATPANAQALYAREKEV